jgi:hypothetical protein
MRGVRTTMNSMDEHRLKRGSKEPLSDDVWIYIHPRIIYGLGLKLSMLLIT